MTYFALESFVDPTDGQLVEAGLTHVSGGADILRMYPSRFRKIQRAGFGPPEAMTRVGGVTGFHRAWTRQRAPSRKRPAERSVELREHYVDYRVSLGNSAREAILDEIKRAHRDAGQEVEAAGWLFGQYRPRAEGDWTEVALATRSIERSGTRGEVYLSDPFEAIAAVHNAGFPHLHLLGDLAQSHSRRPGAAEPARRASLGRNDGFARQDGLRLAAGLALRGTGLDVPPLLSLDRRALRLTLKAGGREGEDGVGLSLRRPKPEPRASTARRW